MKALAFIVALALAGCSSSHPTGRVGPGELTTSAPYTWSHRCQTDCRGCSTQERAGFIELKPLYCREAEP